MTQNPSPSELLGSLPSSVRQRRYFPDLVIFLTEYVGYLLSVAGAAILPTWWLKSLCVISATAIIGSLYVIAHDAGHGSYVPGRRLNRWIARIAFFPAFAPLAAWYRAHVFLHHNFLRVRGKDMVWMPWTIEEFRTASIWQRAWYRFLRTPVGLSFYWTCGNWFPYLLFPPRAEMPTLWRQNQFDRGLVIGFVAIMFIALSFLTHAAADWSWAEPVGPIGIVFLCLLLPYLGWTYLIGLVDLLHHTHPNSICFSNCDEWDYYTANVRSTVHLILPWGMNHMMHNILEHTAHHVDPRIPLYHLPAAQRELESRYAADVSVERVTVNYLARILRTCQLYDYDRRQWLNYAGAATSRADRPEGQPIAQSTTCDVSCES